VISTISSVHLPLGTEEDTCAIDNMKCRSSTLIQYGIARTASSCDPPLLAVAQVGIGISASFDEESYGIELLSFSTAITPAGVRMNNDDNRQDQG
jgi:hypothetical protein